jgi:DNA-binding LacI/PurR family transcriptional regulator
MIYRNRIEDIKDKRSLSYQDIADKAGVTKQTVWNAINKAHKVKVETMEDIWVKIK